MRTVGHPTNARGPWHPTSHYGQFATQVKAYDADTDAVSVVVPGATAGQPFILGIKYSAAALKGQAVPSPRATAAAPFSVAVAPRAAIPTPRPG